MPSQDGSINGKSVIGGTNQGQPVSSINPDEQSVKDWLTQVSGLLLQNYLAGDIAGVQKKLKHYYTRAADNPPDPELGNIETAACHGFLKMAEYFCDQLHFPECLMACDKVRDVLEIKKARFIRNGMEPNPDNATWLALITRLAECKWKSNNSCMDEAISLADMVHYYKSLEVLIRRKLSNMLSTDPQKAQVHVNALAVCGTYILGSVYKYKPSQLSEVKGFFNLQHKGLLDDHTKPHFWKLQIFKEINSPQPNRAQISLCYLNYRKTTLSHKGADVNSHAFDIAVSIEQHYLNQQIAQRESAHLSTKGCH